MLIESGRAITELPWEAALQLSRAIQAKARRAEEIAKAEAVAMDHAILLRSGAPFGLALNRRVRAFAEHLAVTSRRLQRYMPGGVKSQESLGVPVVRHVKGGS